MVLPDNLMILVLLVKMLLVILLLALIALSSGLYLLNLVLFLKSPIKVSLLKYFLRKELLPLRLRSRVCARSARAMLSAMGSDNRFRNWRCLIYPDSAPSNFLDVISSFQIPIALSPLHDHDLKDDGSPDKPHYHMIFCFPGKTSLETVQSLSNSLSGVLPIRCNSVVGSYRYFCHLDNPDKWQYDVSEIRLFGGFKVPSDALVDEVQILEEILAFVIDNHVTELSYLSRVARDLYPCWNRVLLTRNPYYIFRVIDSNRLSSRP